MAISVWMFELIQTISAGGAGKSSHKITFI